MQQKIPTGSLDLNKFLSDGYEKDIITTIYGPGGSGKSNFCILAATAQAAKGSKVIFIDTEGGFSSERFRQIHQGTEEEIKASLQNIFLIKPTSFQEQQKAFQQMLAHVKKESISLIIIDSIAMLYRLELGDAITANDQNKISIVNRRLANQLRTLNEIARKQNIPVIITNQVYSKFETNNQQPTTNDQATERRVSMVGGDLLKYWSKCIIELQNHYGKRKLILKKHRSMPRKELPFEIIGPGIRKKGLF